MPVHPTLKQATLMASIALAALTACKQQPPPTPPPSAAEPTQVTPSTDLRGASDHADAPPAVGALTAGQATGGARSGPVQPTGGDGTRAGAAASSPASSPSSPR